MLGQLEPQDTSARRTSAVLASNWLEHGRNIVLGRVGGSLGHEPRMLLKLDEGHTYHAHGVW